MINLNEFEKDILKSVENREWSSKEDINNGFKELQSYIKN